MATNQQRYIGNFITGDTNNPLIRRGLFQAGATQAIKIGEILEFTADTNQRWTPVDSDFSATADYAIAAEEIKDGDRAGYYNVMIPRPGDIFEFDLSSATAYVEGASMYYSDSETFATSGSNAIATACGLEHYPDKQGHLTDDATGDAGETVRESTKVRVTFVAAGSYYALFNA